MTRAPWRFVSFSPDKDCLSCDTEGVRVTSVVVCLGSRGHSSRILTGRYSSGQLARVSDQNCLLHCVTVDSSLCADGWM